MVRSRVAESDGPAESPARPRAGAPIRWPGAIGSVVLSLMFLAGITWHVHRSTSFDGLAAEGDPIVSGVVLPESLDEQLRHAPGDHAFDGRDAFLREIRRIGLDRHGVILRGTTRSAESSLEAAPVRFIPLGHPEAFAVINLAEEAMRTGCYGEQRVPPRLVAAEDEDLSEEAWTRRVRVGREGYYSDLIRKAGPLRPRPGR